MDEFNELKKQIREWFSKEHFEQMFSQENWKTLFTKEKLMQWLPVAIPCVTLLIVLTILLSTCSAQKTPQQTANIPAGSGLKPISRDVRVESSQGDLLIYRGQTTISPVTYALVLENGDSVSVGSGAELLISLDGDKTAYAEENTSYRMDVSGRMGSTATNFYLTSGALLCNLKNNLKTTETFSVETPTCTVNAGQAVFRVSVLPGEVNYTLVAVFSGSASVALKDTGDKLTLYSGQCALIQNAQRFVLDDELAASFWKNGQSWNKEVKQDGSGRSTLSIPYEKLPAGTLNQLIRIVEEKQKLILGKADLETLLETGHNYRETIMQHASCTEKGHSRYACPLCGDSYEEDTPALGHTAVEDLGVEATCTRSGRSDGSHCSVCNAVLVPQKTMEALGHTLVIEEAKEVTCTEDGLTEGRYCSVCGEVLSVQTVIPKTGHTVVIDAAIEPTCSSVGYTQGSHCSTCNEVLSGRQELEKTSHTAVADPAVEATCTQEGKTEGSHCSVCGEILKKQQTVPKKEHTPVTDPAVNPTCTSDGKTEGSHCSVCGTVFTAQQTVPGGHKTEPVTRNLSAQETTDTVCSRVEYVCTVCGAVVRTEERGHTIQEHTETREDGTQVTTRSCSVCGRRFS